MRCFWIGSILVLVLGTCWGNPARAELNDYQAYCLYLANNDYPDGNPDYDQDVQGIGHDTSYWYITQTEYLWRIPVELPLASANSGDPGVFRFHMDHFSDLTDLGYAHFGDPVGYRHEETDYLLVPIENDAIGLTGAVAVFRCPELEFLDLVELPLQSVDAGWCAVDEVGHLYSSFQHASTIFQYDFDWEQLHTTSDASVTFLSEIPLLDEQGHNVLDLETMQGGEFGPDGKLLYLLSGFHDDNNQEMISEGIHVMDTTTWRRIAHSTNGYGYFNYDYSTVWDGEPEGLTVWDLDDGRAPNVRGQLHVFMLDNEAFDDVTLYHYTNVWRVDRNAPCSTGEPTCPFRTIGAAQAAILDRCEMRIQANVYPEALVLTKPVRLTAQGGTVRIGG